MSRRYVIVGNGAAGWRAAVAIREREPGASVDVLTDEPAPCYMRPRLPALLSGTMAEEQILVSRFMDYVAKDVELLQRPAIGIDLQGHRIMLRGGKSLLWDALLLATGSRPRPLPVEGGSSGIVLRTLVEAQELNARIVPGIRACVVGGGLLGMDFVRSLRARKVEVTWLIRESHFWARVPHRKRFRKKKRQDFYTSLSFTGCFFCSAVHPYHVEKFLNPSWRLFLSIGKKQRKPADRAGRA